MTTHLPEKHMSPQTDADYLLGVRQEELRQVGLESYAVTQEGLALGLRDMPSLYAADPDLIGVIDAGGQALKMYALGDVGVILAASDFYLHQSRGRHARHEPQTNYVVIGLGDGPRSFGGDASGAELLGLNAQGVSASNFSVEVADGGVVLRGKGPHAGVRIITTPPDPEYRMSELAPEDVTHRAIHTAYTHKDARLLGKLDEDERFASRKLIGRNTIMGGSSPEATVDIRSWSAGAEAIVVEEDGDPTGKYGALRTSALERVNALLQDPKRQGRLLTEPEVLRAINESVAAAMQYDRAFVDSLSGQLVAQGEEWRLVNLDYYLAAGKGICRHMALACAWLGGELAEVGLLSGRLTADVNQRVATPDAHEWARYESESGEIYILDPTGPYFGRLGDPNAPWNYLRPEEQWMTKRKVVGGLAVITSEK